MKRTALLLSSSILVIALLFSSSFIASERPVFLKHKLHIDEGCECTSCHVAADGKQLPVLNPEFCKECHEDVSSNILLPGKGRPMAIRFPHKLHEDAAECTDCHAADAADTRKAGEPVMGFARCVSCHEENDVKVPDGNCVACHGHNQRQVPPSDHTSNWAKHHGVAAEWRVFKEHGKDCSTCHHEAACVSCHKHTRPSSHTALWRVRLHGKVAEWDRESCRTCHETGSCIACHKTVEPLNHTGAWLSGHGLVAESRSSQYCATCHRPSYCAACHAGNPISNR